MKRCLIILLIFLFASCSITKKIEQPAKLDASFTKIEVSNSDIVTDFNYKLPELESTKQIRRENWTRLGLFTGSIVCNAIGDGLNNSGNKDLGHLFNAASIGITLSIPLLIDVNKNTWYAYLLEYAFLRFALFDYTYNAVAGLPFNYHGKSNYYDRFMNQNETWIFQKSVIFSVGISINFNDIIK